MRTNGFGWVVDFNTKWVVGLVFCMGMGLTVAFPVFAEQPVAPTDVPPPPPPPPDPVPPPGTVTPGPNQPKSPDQMQVEAAMGRPLDREYNAFEATTQYQGAQPSPFASYLYDSYESKRTSGVIMAGVLAPIFASMTVGGTLLLYRHGVTDNGGFCNHITRDDDGEYNRDCRGDRGELSGMIMISTLGTVLTLAMLIPGAVKAARYSKRLRRLDPLVSRSIPSAPPPRLTWAIGPKEVSLGLMF